MVAGPVNGGGGVEEHGRGIMVCEESRFGVGEAIDSSNNGCGEEVRIAVRLILVHMSQL